MQVIDGFLDERRFRAFREAVLAPSFPWEWSEVIANPDPPLPEGCNRQQVHGFYLRKPDVFFQSPWVGLLTPVLEPLRPRLLLKAKLNRTPRQPAPVAYGMHVDTRWRGATTAVLYLNSNDGGTLFEDGARVDSVANRLVLFDARRRHTGVACTDAAERLVLNLNLLLGEAPLT